MCETSLQHEFVLAENPKSLFNLWLNANVSFERTNFDRDTLEQNEIYFTRRNVAKRFMKIQTQNNRNQPQISEICRNLIENSQFENFCQNFQNAINSLTLHSNNLATEYCDEIEEYTIWIPE